jgi:NTE family protein
MKKLKKNRKIGLALGGGAVLGAAHVGVLRALEEFEISINCVAGTSIGAFVSAFFAFNKHWTEIKEITLDLNWLDISALSLSKMGLLSNEKLGKLITEHIGDVNFAKADIPIAMISTDISNGEKIILKEGKVADAVMASTCIPGIFIPLEIGNKLLVDGGIVENVPITPLKEMGADFIIAVDLNAEYSHKKPEGIVEVLLNTYDFTIMTATKLQTEEADVLIKPDLSSFNMVDTNQTADLIEQGYLEAKKVFNRIT